MNIFVVSLGCSKNLVDTEVMLGLLARRGCMVVEDPAKADCLLVNTCSFLLTAVEESLDRIMELARMKEKKKRLVVAGCLVSRYGDEILKEIPEVDALVSPAGLPAVIAAVYGGGQNPPAPDTGLSSRDPGLLTLDSGLSILPRGLSTLDSELSPLDSELCFPFPPRYLSGPPHRAYLKIGEGCSNRCAFCLIPSLRGEFASRSRESLMAEMDHLARIGVREVTLVAQDSGSYGMDGGEENLPALLESLLSVREDHFWLRTLYVHPRRVTDELLTVMGSDSRVCRYLDIPFQHVSPGVLGRMGRSDAPPPLEMVARIRDRLPGVFLRSTLMTGFPGETDRDFEDLMDFLGEARIDHLGVFCYSREEGTPAAAMDGQVDPEVARERADLLMQEQALISSKNLADLRGREMEILVEGMDEDGPWGRHQGQAPEVDGVVRLGREAGPGRFVRVRITGSGDYDLEAKILDPE